MRALVLVLLLSGCVQDTREVQTTDVEAGALTMIRSPFSLADETVAFEEFLAMWRARYAKTPDVDGTRVTYDARPYFTRGSSGYKYGGATEDPDSVSVAWGGKACVFQTALIHELTHVGLWREGDPDSNHALPVWDDVRPARDRVRDRICCRASKGNAIPCDR